MKTTKKFQNPLY